MREFEYLPKLFLFCADWLLLNVTSLNCLLEPTDHYDGVESTDNQPALAHIEKSLKRLNLDVALDRLISTAPTGFIYLYRF